MLRFSIFLFFFFFFLEFIPSSLLTFFGDFNDTDRSALLELTKNISRSRLTADTEREFLEGLKVRYDYLADIITE